MQRNDLNRSLVAFDHNSTFVAAVELSLKNWVVSGIVPGVKRHPVKKLTAERLAARNRTAPLALCGGRRYISAQLSRNRQ